MPSSPCPSRRTALATFALPLAALSLGIPRLSATDPQPPAPAVDIVLPHFASRPPFRLSEHRGRFVALHFLLKTECPVCLRLTRAILDRASELPEVQQILIKPDSQEEIAKWARELPAGIPLYRDADAALARRLGIPGGYAFHGETVHYPALILIAPNGREAFRHVGRSNQDRYDFDRLAAKVRELRAAGGNPTAP